MARAVIAALVLAALAAGCALKTDLGQICQMTKPCTPGPTCQMTMADLSDSKIDYLAFDQAQCDDACLRPAGATSTDPVGYCTSPCISASSCAGAYACEQILPSAQFMAGLKQGDPATYQSMFGSDDAATWCVQSD